MSDFLYHRLNGIRIDSRWGALAALIALQCYGLTLFHYFSEGLRTFWTSPFEAVFVVILSFFFGLAFLSTYLFIQSVYLRVIWKVLVDSSNRDAWMNELRYPRNQLRMLSIPVLVLVYSFLFFTPTFFGFHQTSTLLAAIYQVAHPYLSLFARKYWKIKEMDSTDWSQSSIPKKVFSTLLGVGFGAVFWGVARWARKRAGNDFIPFPLWAFSMVGISIMTLIGIFLLLEDFTRSDEDFLNMKQPHLNKNA